MDWLRLFNNQYESEMCRFSVECESGLVDIIKLSILKWDVKLFCRMWILIGLEEN